MIHLKKLGIMDIGSNSIKLLIANLYSERYFDITYEEKIQFRMGQFIDSKKDLTTEGFYKLRDILIYFKHICEVEEVTDIKAIATETMRRLKNSENIIHQLQHQLHITIELIPGELEAYYGYLATHHTIDLSDYLQIDIGGSSMEIVLVKQKQLIHAISLPLGAIITTKNFELDSSLTKDKEKLFNAHMKQTFEEISWLKDAIHLPVIGIGGTIRTISKLYRNRIGDSLKLQHQYHLSDTNLEEMYQLLAPLTLKDRQELKGLSKDRADIVLGCLMTIRSLFNYIDSKSLIINRYGIRQGVIFNQLNIPPQSVLDYSLSNLLYHYRLPIHHNDRLKQSSITLANQLQINDLSSTNILKASSKLSDIGQIISYQNNAKHTFYLLMNISINGLNVKEQLMTAYTIRAGEKYNLKIEPEHQMLLSTEEFEHCKKLSLIVQLCSYLNALKSEFNSIDVSEEAISIKFSKTIPSPYLIRLNQLSTLYLEQFNRPLKLIMI
ncbi:Ppx/GppA family phosphatase [Turicibacter sp. HGF1]|uniref:Ppx/GppA family phosphatase n=1 Tax=Turicibacter sp. HGF1 TaxID=910310 RepID=UPI001EE65932|nr:Ppx/GppA family phosphatase [Turicibacter sp. HGF1]